MALKKLELLAANLLAVVFLFNPGEFARRAVPSHITSCLQNLYLEKNEPEFKSLPYTLGKTRTKINDLLYRLEKDKTKVVPLYER